MFFGVIAMCDKKECKLKSERNAKRNQAIVEKAQLLFEKKTSGNFQMYLSSHVRKRTFERSICDRELVSAIQNGWVIEFYPRQKKVTILTYTKVGGSYRPLHLSIGYGGGNINIITAYRPDVYEWKWDTNYEVRLCYCDDMEEGY